MSNVAKVLKAEIARISKSEAKSATKRIGKSNAWLRKVAGDLKRRVVLLEKENKHLLAAMKKFQEESPGATAREARLRVLVNQRVAGSVVAGADWADAELLVVADFWRPGRNAVRLRLLDEGVSVAVAGLWVEPAR